MPLFGRVADLIFPRACVLCGTPLREGRTYPLCAACEGEVAELPSPRCPRCGRPLISERGLCMGCRRHLPDYDEALPLFDYRGSVGRLVSAYKFGGRRSLAPWFASRLAPSIAARWPGLPLVPVPPRPSVLKERGWDHVELVARNLERKGFTLLRLLVRVASPQQKSLGHEERARNAAAAYRLARSASASAEASAGAGAVPPEGLVLLDDVFTTGATAEACARLLKAGGARFVAFASIAAD